MVGQLQLPLVKCLTCLGRSCGQFREAYLLNFEINAGLFRCRAKNFPNASELADCKEMIARWPIPFFTELFI